MINKICVINFCIKLLNCTTLKIVFLGPIPELLFLISIKWTFVYFLLIKNKAKTYTANKINLIHENIITLRIS